MRKLTMFAALTAAATYFFAPQNGKRRRAMARDRLVALFRTAERKAEAAARAAVAEASGLAAKAQHVRQGEKPQPDDVTLAHKVETELFRNDDVPKGQININAEHGKIVLRGEVQRPELISDLEERVRQIEGVQEVENLLHLAGTPAPMHQ